MYTILRYIDEENGITRRFYYLIRYKLIVIVTGTSIFLKLFALRTDQIWSHLFLHANQKQKLNIIRPQNFN